MQYARCACTVDRPSASGLMRFVMSKLLLYNEPMASRYAQPHRRWKEGKENLGGQIQLAAVGYRSCMLPFCIACRVGDRTLPQHNQPRGRYVFCLRYSVYKKFDQLSFLHGIFGTDERD